MRHTYMLYLLLLMALSGAQCNDGKNDPITTSGCKITNATNYDGTAVIADNCKCKFDGLNPSCNMQHPTVLVIPPVIQETEVWCWLAVGEMIFRYYGLPSVNPAGDYQCGIVGAVGYSLNGACDACNVNCANCVRPAGAPQMISHMLSAYPKIACRNLFTANKTLNQTYIANFISANALIAELDNKRPVIAGINPGAQFVLPGNSMHVALIIGYHFYLGNLILHVNDPYPYITKGIDPYLLNGAAGNGRLYYEIPYFNFVNGLKWNTAWINIGWPS